MKLTMLFESYPSHPLRHKVNELAQQGMRPIDIKKECDIISDREGIPKISKHTLFKYLNIYKPDRSRYTEEQRKEAINRIMSGETKLEVSKSMKIPKSAIDKWWNEDGAGPLVTKKSQEELVKIKEAIESGGTREEVCNKFGLSQRTLYYYIKKYDWKEQIRTKDWLSVAIQYLKATDAKSVSSMREFCRRNNISHSQWSYHVIPLISQAREEITKEEIAFQAELAAENERLAKIAAEAAAAAQSWKDPALWQKPQEPEPEPESEVIPLNGWDPRDEQDRPEDRRPRVLLVGGMESRNLPEWMKKYFDVTMIDSSKFSGMDTTKMTNKFGGHDPDLIIIQRWLGHKLSVPAAKMAHNFGIPRIYAMPGWSQARQQAEQQGIEWFIDAYDRPRKPETPITSDILRDGMTFSEALDMMIESVLL